MQLIPNGYQTMRYLCKTHMLSQYMFYRICKTYNISTTSYLKRIFYNEKEFNQVLKGIRNDG